MARRSFFGLLAAIFSVAGSAAAQTWYVDAANVDDPAADGSAAHPFWQVQTALNTASNSDTILVLPGQYVENIDFVGKNVLLVSRDGPAATILDGVHYLLSTVTFAAGETRAAEVRGFTITNGSGTGNGSFNIGGGIRVYQASPTIRDNWIIQNTAHFGGGIDCEESDPLIVGNLISGNFVGDNHLRHITGDGGGISVYNSSAHIYANRIINNTANRQGGGIVVQDDVGTDTFPMNVICANNEIIGNVVETRVGGGIAFFFRGNLDVSGCTIVGNTAVSANGIFATGSSVPATMTLTNSILYANNNATGSGQGFVNSGATLDVSYSDVENGESTFVVGGSAVLNWGSGNISAGPLFRNDDGGDYRLTDCSPCVQAGDPAATGAGETDVDAEPRVFAGRIDMGAHELIFADCDGDGIPNSCDCPGDLNGDCTISLQDLANLLANFGSSGSATVEQGDLDGDADVDLQDLATLLSRFGAACS
ncbi:MAG: hypothetical protein HZB38_02990 [Planctomycetes bacterium]|nr:hypothetical protein [Planctomycetota bacterium]